MSLKHELSIVHHAEHFHHGDANRIYQWALSKTTAAAATTIVIDLGRARDATTSAFAHLVLLRRKLLRAGRDLRLTNLRERAARVYEVNRLNNVLPMQ